MKTPRKVFTNAAAKRVLPALFAVLTLGIAGRAGAQTPPPSPTNKVSDAKSPAAVPEPTEEPANWVTLGLGGAFTGGSRNQFQARSGQPAGVLGGLEDFHLETFLGKKGLLELDGRALLGEQNYSARLGVADPDLGFLRGGFRQTRTWYDGSGGYFPATGKSLSFYDENLHLDRGEFWFEGGWTPADGPLLTLKLSREYRRGTKDSLIWGDSTQAGAQRGIVPSLRDINELRHRVEADVKHTFGRTDVGLGVRVEFVDNKDEFKERRRPGEAANRYVTQRDVVNSDLFNIHASTETRVTERVWLTTGYSYTRLSTEVGGSRIYGASFDAPYLPSYPGKQARDEGFVNLSGGSVLDQYVMNLALRLEPADDWVVVPSLRAEKLDTSGDTSFTENTTGSSAPFPATSALLYNSRENGLVTVTEALEVRYTGFTNWVLYTRGEWGQTDGYLRELEQDLTAKTTDLARSTDLARFTQKYTLGLNWYPLRRLNFSGQFYHQTRENEYTHAIDSTLNASPSGDRYPAFLRQQNFQTDDLNVRATWRPLPNVTSVTRYDFQIASIDTRGDNLARLESAQTTAHIISQSLTWLPWSRLFLQGSLSYALDATTTPATALTGGATGLVGNAGNDYWQAGASATFAVDEKTDLQAAYSIYRANNFINNSPASVPYGASAKDYSVTASLLRNFSKRVRGSVGYGYFNHRDETNGGRDSYDAHLIFSSVTYRF